MIKNLSIKRMSFIKSKFKYLVTLLLTFTLFLQSAEFVYIRSLAVMSVYSYMNYKDSFMSEASIRVSMPGGLSTPFETDFYPFVMIYDASNGVSKYIGRDMETVIYYNFGAFDLSYGASFLYDQASPYYCAFYGVYVVKDNEADGHYGYDENGQIISEEIMEISNYDIKKLVLGGFDYKNPSITYNSLKELDPITIDGKVFRVIESQMDFPGFWHRYTRDYMAYLQYGQPPTYTDGKELSSFELTKGYGRVYIYNDLDSGVDYYLYQISTDYEKMLQTEDDYIMKFEFDE